MHCQAAMTILQFGCFSAHFLHVKICVKRDKANIIKNIVHFP